MLSSGRRLQEHSLQHMDVSVFNMCPFRAEGSRMGVIVGSIILVLPFAYLAWIALHVWMHVVNVSPIQPVCFQKRR